MQDARRQRLARHVRRGEAKHVCRGNRLRAEAGPENIANDAADARIRPAVRLEGRGVIVRFNFEGQVVLFVEPHDPGVVAEHAHAPIVVAKLMPDRVRGRKDRLLEHVFEPPFAGLVAIGDAAGERFVATVFAPGLGDCLQLSIGRIATQLFEMPLDRAHLQRLQVKLPLAAERGKLLTVQPTQGDFLQLKQIFAAELESLKRQRPDKGILNRLIGQCLQHEGFERRFIEAREPILAKRPHIVERNAQAARRFSSALRDGIHHPCLGHHLNKSRLCSVHLAWRGE
jgi:hypothetical protein